MRSSWSRRAVLRGAGGMLALPWLASWGERALAEGDRPQRLLVVFFPNGARPETFRPSGEGRDWVANSTSAPLERVRDELLIVSGLSSVDPATMSTEVDAPHDRAMGGFFTAEDPFQPPVGRQRGRSLDQVIAPAIAAGGDLTSIELSSEAVNACPFPGGCTHGQYLSFSEDTRPIPRITSTLGAFQRILGVSEPNSERIAWRLRTRRSVLDGVLAEANALRSVVSATDWEVLDRYFTSVRGVEQRLAPVVAASCQDASGAIADRLRVAPTVEEHAEVMLDLATLAVTCGRSNTVSYMFGTEGGRKVYTGLGLYEDHHFLSHHGGRPERLAAIDQVTTWEMEVFARTIEALAAMPGPRGRMLDDTLVMGVGAIGDPDLHDHRNLPVVLAGGAGRLRLGEHVVVDAPFANLATSVMGMFGMAEEPFGRDGTGPLSTMLRS
jgi:hypothetical protein